METKNFSMTHAEMVECACSWLKRKYPIVISEMVSGASETPDAIGFDSGTTTIVECKVTRADFLRDKKKWFRQNPEQGMGNYRYFLTLPGVIKPEEVDEKWGLLIFNPETKRFRRLKEAVQQESHLVSQQKILISCIRRIGQTPMAGVSVRAYTHDTKQIASVSIDCELEDGDGL